MFSRRGRGGKEEQAAGVEAGEGDITDQRRDFCGGSERRAERVVGRGRRSVAASAGLPRRPPVFIPRRRRPPPAVAWLRLPFYLPATYLPFPTAHLRCARPRAGVPCATNPPLPPKPVAWRGMETGNGRGKLMAGGVYVPPPVNSWISLAILVGDQFKS